MTAGRLLVSIVGTWLAIAALPTMADPMQDELQRLRNENAQLRQQLDQLRLSTPNAAAATNPAQAPNVLPATEAPGASSAPVASTMIAPPAPVAPPGYKLLKDVPEAPYSRTGCRKYKDAVDTRWKQRDNWESLARGQTTAEVEDLLGIEHHDIADGRRTGWQYGKCEASVRGVVVFEAGKVLYWDQPTF